MEHLSRGCMVEFNFVGPDWQTIGSGFGTVRHRDTVYSDGTVVTLSDVIGDSPQLQEALNGYKFGDLEMKST